MLDPKEKQQEKTEDTAEPTPVEQFLIDHYDDFELENTVPLRELDLFNEDDEDEDGAS